MKYLTFLFIGLFAFIPQDTFAIEGLVSCQSAQECNFCAFTTMVNAVTQWIVVVSISIAVLIIVYAGFRLVSSRGDVSATGEARKLISNAVVGLLIILFAWTIVDTLLKALVGGDFGVWQPNDCGQLFEVEGPDDFVIEADTHAVSVYEAESIVSVGGEIFTGDLRPVPSTGCASCVSISSFVTCKKSSSCTVQGDYAERLAGLLRVHPNRMTVTEAYPPTRTHQAACHQNGSCVDIVFSDRGVFSSKSKINSFISQAKALGFRAVYEPPSSGTCSGISSCQPHSVTRSTGSHFSLYE